MILATVNTGHFTFEVVAETENKAKTALMRAWRTHAEQTGADQTLMSYMIVDGDVTFKPLELDVVLRDGSPIQGTAPR